MNGLLEQMSDDALSSSRWQRVRGEDRQCARLSLQAAELVILSSVLGPWVLESMRGVGLVEMPIGSRATRSGESSV